MINKEMNREVVESSIKNTPSGYILDIDIDHFEMINKNYGRDIGDKVLFRVPEIVKSILKVNGLDIDVTRIGGDEFIAIIKEKPIDFVKSISSEIISSMDREFDFDGTKVKLSICIGISEFSINRNNDAVKDANAAMIQAKKNGRNQYKLLEV